MYNYIFLLSILSSVHALYILPTINDEEKFCYGILYINMDSDINIDYKPTRYNPYWYNFINSTLSINKLEKYYIIRYNMFIKYVYGSSLPIYIDITTKIQNYNNTCFADIKCTVNNFIYDTSTVLSRFNYITNYLYFTKSCIVKTTYNVKTIKNISKQTCFINTYDIISVYLLICVSILLIVYYVINNNNIENKI
ncbi:type-I membrane glycoprotein [Yokapox virus]|uniref:Type-I membrane glycoprotein n=1 Tax=Yokapox virus TaxID=1076255 RepID=G3EI38_9POXV|nr:type-I membrane glycoprotein [Yokapox virus]AEN03735.1 type-I membrane glycoprotein [Yokapox virus]